MNRSSSLATRLKILIDTANSQKEVARLAGVSDGTLINWLRGCGVRESKLRQVARKIGVSFHWLRDGVGDAAAEIKAFRAQWYCRVMLSRNKFFLARARHNFSLNSLARRVGCPPALLDQIEHGRMRASDDLIESLCEVLPGLSRKDFARLTAHSFMWPGDTKEATYGAEPEVLLADGTKGRCLPLLSCAQVGKWKAGWALGLRDYPAIFAPAVEDRHAFAIKVLGNSMEPVLHEGDLAVCSPSWPLHNGEVAVVRTRREQVFISFWRQSGGRALLESAHADYPPIDLPLTKIVGAWPILQAITAGKVRRVRGQNVAAPG